MQYKGLVLLAQAGFTLVLILLLGAFYILGFHFFHPITIYYFGIGTIFIGTFILLILFYIFHQKIRPALEKFSLLPRDFFPCLLAAALVIYSFHITIPTLVDRSISMYLLNQLASHGGEDSLENLQNKFQAGYVGGYSVVCRRMAEQITSGNIVHKASIYSLTSRGERTVKFLRAFAVITGVNPYYVNSDNVDLLPYRYIATSNGCKPVSQEEKNINA